jgi:DNA-directed RNA polymerase subunit H (RpoH/RPB5)
MSESQYEQYKNLNVFAKDWRKYIPQSTSILSEDAFRKEMQTNKYVLLEYANSKTGRSVLIYLLSNDSNYANNSQALKRLLARIKEKSEVILVSKEPFKVYSVKTIRNFAHLDIKTYLHANFSLIAPNGPLCYSHRILTDNEVNTLLNDSLCCRITNLPGILQDDVQCIWIGAEVGDIIEITAKSDIAGESIHYRVVIPSDGKIVSFRAKNDGEVKVEDTKKTVRGSTVAKKKVTFDRTESDDVGETEDVFDAVDDAIVDTDQDAEQEDDELVEIREDVQDEGSEVEDEQPVEDESE